MGIDGDVLVVTQPTDIYVHLDWLHSQYMNKIEQTENAINKAKWENAANYVATLMELAEKDGFGSPDDIMKAYN